MNALEKSSSPRAFVWVAAVVLASVCCAAVFVAVSVTQRANAAQRQLQQDIVIRGADAIGLSFNTALKREWDSMHAVARNIGNGSKTEADDFMDAVVQTGGQVAWSAVADLDGIIVSGSNRLREGEEVSERRWYREGLRGSNVGNVHSNNSLLRDTDNEKQTVLNLSTPVYGEDTGKVMGVLVYSLRIEWVQSFLTQAKEKLNIDVVVQNRDGLTVVDTREITRPLPEAAVMQASLGRNVSGSFHMLDQDEGLYAFSPNFINESLPDFGWKVFAILDRSSVINVMPELLKSSVISVSIAALFVLAVTLITMRIILKPIENLSSTAVLVANGKFEYPVESRSSFEAIMLSRALARIQTTLALQQSLQAGKGPPTLKLLSGSEDLLSVADDEPLDGRPGGKWSPAKSGGKS